MGRGGLRRDWLWMLCLRTALLFVLLSLLTEAVNDTTTRSVLGGAGFGLSTRFGNPSYQHAPRTQDSHCGKDMQHQRPNSFWNRQTSLDGQLAGGPPPPPPPPKELPLRFLRAGKGNPVVGLQRYEATLAWRKREKIDGILHEPFPDFAFIKQHYLHFFHLKGRNGEPCFYEQPARTNLRALREGGVNLEKLLRHYIVITEFQWQYLERRDLANSIYVIDLADIRMRDFFGETVDFVKKAAAISAQHYPERAGYVFVVNVPSWFKLIWQVVRPIVDEATLKKIYILRGADEIRQNLLQRIALEHIPPEYGGASMPLGHAPEEIALANLMAHNNILLAHRRAVCEGCRADTEPKHWACSFCRWTPARSY